MRLEGKISEYQSNEVKLREKIKELLVKNAVLLEQFQLSSPSKNKFWEMNTHSIK